MKYGLLFGALFIIILSVSVFATAPIMGTMTVSPVYVTDHNYSKWTNPYTMILIAHVTPAADMNIDRNTCQYTLNGGFSWVTVPNDFNVDNNFLTVPIQFGGTNNHIFGLQCADINMSYATPVLRELYLDVSAPQSSAVYNGTDAVLYSIVDRSTSIGNGSGVKRGYFSVDGSAWYSVVASSGSISTTSLSPGMHNVLYYATDNLDNNEMTFREGNPQFLSFTIVGITNSTCNVTMLLILVLVAAAIISILGLAYSGNLNMMTISAVGITMITFLVIIIITGQVNAIMCAL